MISAKYYRTQVCVMALATVRSIGFSRALQSLQDEEDFEQELVDQFALAQVGAGLTDQFVRTERSVISWGSRSGRPRRPMPIDS